MPRKQASLQRSIVLCEDFCYDVSVVLGHKKW